MAPKKQKEESTKWIEYLAGRESFVQYHIDNSNNDNKSHPFGPEVITGLAKINGRPVALYAHNPKVKRGYISSQGAKKICRLMGRAYDLKIPIIALLSSPGVFIEEGIYSGDQYTKVISKNISLSGVIPQLAVILGPTLGASAYSTVLMDFIFFNKNRSHLMLTSPTVVQQAISEKTTMSELGGAAMHASVTGIADFVDETIPAQLERVKSIITLLPSSTYDHPPVQPPANPVMPLPEIPNDLKLPFDMMKLIAALVDASYLIEYKSSFGQAIICVFAYLNGYPVGILGNQSLRLSGAIDSDASEKSARFLRICDAYNIPILTLIDSPGFMPGKKEEQKGLLKYGAKFCTAMQTTVPRISLVVRRCYGAAAFLMMQTKSQGGDLVLALDTAHIGIMGKEAATQVTNVDQCSATFAERNTSEEQMTSLQRACSLGLINEVLPLTQVRKRLADHLQWLYKKQSTQHIIKKHSIDP